MRTRWSFLLKGLKRQFPKVETLSTNELAMWLNNTKRPNPLLLDIREASEYKVSHLPGAIHLPPKADETRLKALLKKQRPLVLYCSVGYRSSQMVERFKALDPKVQIYNLEGSIFKWANEKRPMKHEGESTKEVHPYSRLWGSLLKAHVKKTYRAQEDTPTSKQTKTKNKAPL